MVERGGGGVHISSKVNEFIKTVSIFLRGIYATQKTQNKQKPVNKSKNKRTKNHKDNNFLPGKTSKRWKVFYFTFFSI